MAQPLVQHGVRLPTVSFGGALRNMGAKQLDGSVIGVEQY
jgi:hypothetical protein